MRFTVYLQQGRKPVKISEMNGSDTIGALITKLKKIINSSKLISRYLPFIPKIFNVANNN